MDRNLYQKLSREEALTAEETLRLDAMLEQSTPAEQWVTQIEDSEMSFAWRSSLNEKLIQRSAKRRQAKFWSFGSTAVAAAATVFAIFIVQRQSPVETPTTTNNVAISAPGPIREGALVRSHNDAVVQASLGVTMPAESGSSPFDWSTIDSL